MVRKDPQVSDFGKLENDAYHSLNKRVQEKEPNLDKSRTISGNHISSKKC